MKKILLAALMAGVATTAFASDLPTRKAPPAPAPVYVAPAFSWTGFYIGVNGGGAFANGGRDFGNPNGGEVGGTVGYNYQLGQIVLGVEGDWDWAGINKNGVNAVGPYKNNVDDIVTARARVGYAIDRTLLFVTGGYAGADEQIKFPGLASNSTWRNGGVVGGGVEYAFTNNISAKVEYLYAPFGNEQTLLGEKSDLNLSLVRAGVNYKF
ncbi:MAG: porin family protein [Hyphomicrobiales bacterium]|nr:porin family protein [Hyphomicrobiales bacterium]MBV8662402.1 porin family protein [Hyphomicrobiales bacterium]